MAIEKKSPVAQPSTARGRALPQDRLAKLLPPTDEQVQEQVEFWLIVLNSFEGEF